MELLEGRNLKEIVREHGALEPAVAVDIVLQILARGARSRTGAASSTATSSRTT